MSDKKQKEVWNKSISKNGVTKRAEARRLDNGYLITVQTFGTKKNSKGDDEYFDETKEIFSKENPFEEDDEDEFKVEKKLIDDMKKSVYTPSIFDLV